MEDLQDVFSNGLLASVFKISRFVSVAPFRYTHRGPVISRCLTIYGYIVVTFINVAVLTGFAIDLQTDTSRSLRTSTPTSCMLWIANFTIVIMIISADVYRGSRRFASNITIVKQIIKIKMFIDIKAKDSEKRNRTLVIVMSTGLCFLIISDLCASVREAILSDKEVIIILMYALLYYEYIQILFIELQFVLLAWQLQFILKCINQDLKKQIHDVLENNCEHRYPLEVVNASSIRNFAVAYGLVCDVVRQLNDEYGLVLLLIVLSFFLQLVITPYYMITTLYSSLDWKTNVVFQILWCIFHICDMILVVEPCHRTQEEFEQTRILVCLMLRSVSTTDTLMLAELDLFCKQLILNRPSYSPMGMCTMSRPLMVTIIGAVMTYLVIVFQFYYKF